MKVEDLSLDSSNQSNIHDNGDYSSWMSERTIEMYKCRHSALETTRRLLFRTVVVIAWPDNIRSALMAYLNLRRTIKYDWDAFVTCNNLYCRIYDEQLRISVQHYYRISLPLRRIPTNNRRNDSHSIEIAFVSVELLKWVALVLWSAFRTTVNYRKYRQIGKGSLLNYRRTYNRWMWTQMQRPAMTPIWQNHRWNHRHCVPAQLNSAQSIWHNTTFDRTAHHSKYHE